MSLKQEIETWVQALAHYDNNEFEQSLQVFDTISDTSKILFNCGVIHATLGQHEKAVECYQRCVAFDKYLAVAYFQEGVSNFLTGDFNEALANFNDALLYLRGNTCIDYEQLGLKFRLFSCEVLFNRGLSYVYLGHKEDGMRDLEFAAKEKMTSDHDVIDEAIREQAEGYTVFSIPVGVVYRPNEAKVKNLKTKDYLGKAHLVAADHPWNAFIGFAGSENKAAISTDSRGRNNGPLGGTSYAASNLVNPNLTSQKPRDRSAPPAMEFPPTPPPDNPQPLSAPTFASHGMTGRAGSVRNPANRLQPVSLQRTNTIGSSMSDPRSLNNMERAVPPIIQDPMMVSPPRRMGTIRTNSEPAVASVRRAPSRTPSRPLYGEREEFYDMYTSQPPKDTVRRGGSKEFGRSRQPAFIEEEEDEEGYVSDAYEGEDFMQDVGVDFEMVGGAGALSSRHTRGSSGHQRTSSRRIIEVKKIRVKVQCNDDPRYLMIGPTIKHGDFEAKVREKFCLRKKLRMRTQDDGDMTTMITIADQDDLDALIESAKSAARREKQDMGKMDVWIDEF